MSTAAQRIIPTTDAAHHLPSEVWRNVCAYLTISERVALSTCCKLLLTPARAFEAIDFSFVGSLHTVGLVDRQYGSAGIISPSEYPEIVSSAWHVKNFEIMQSHEGHVATVQHRIRSGSILDVRSRNAKTHLAYALSMYAVARKGTAHAIEHTVSMKKDADSEMKRCTVKIMADLTLESRAFKQLVTNACSMAGSNLRTLRAFDCHFDATALFELAATCKHIALLEIPSVLPRRVNSRMGTLSAAVANWSSTLQVLDISGADISTTEMSELLGSLPNLHTLRADYTCQRGPWLQAPSPCTPTFPLYGCDWLFGRPSMPSYECSLRDVSMKNTGHGYLHLILAALFSSCTHLRRVELGYDSRDIMLDEFLAVPLHHMFPVPLHGIGICSVPRLDMNMRIFMSSTGLPHTLFGVPVDAEGKAAPSSYWLEEEVYEHTYDEALSTIQQSYKAASERSTRTVQACADLRDAGYVSPATKLWYTVFSILIESPARLSLESLVIHGTIPMGDSLITTLVQACKSLQEIVVQSHDENDVFFSLHPVYGVIMHQPYAPHDCISDAVRDEMFALLRARRIGLDKMSD